MSELRVLLDTNIVSDLMRNPRGRARQRIEERASGDAAISIVTLAELRFGVAKTQSLRLGIILEELAEIITVLPLEEPVDRRYAELRVHLERIGRPIGPNDMLIAAHAIVLDRVLITANTREFTRVPGLKVENWLE